MVILILLLVGVGRRRSALLSGASALAGLEAAGHPAPARADVTKLLDKSLHRYAKQLQREADVLVFEGRPLVQEANWTALGELFRGDGYPNDVLHTVEFVVVGNEDFLPGAEEAGVKLDAAFRDMGRAIEAKSREKHIYTYMHMYVYIYT